MNTYSISYDLGGPETSASYKDLIEGIKGLGRWCKPLESYWLVSTSMSSIEIKEYLTDNFLDKNDKLLVMHLFSTDWASQGLSGSVLEWMHSNV